MLFAQAVYMHDEPSGRPGSAAGATALQVTLTFSGTVGGQRVTIPIDVIAAGDASCVTPTTITPTETGLTSEAGPTAGGTKVTITGTGSVSGAATVAIGGITIPANQVTVTSPSTLTFATPAHAPRQVDVTSTTGGGSTTPRTFTYRAAPTITGIAPTIGSATGGTVVTVTGTGFIPGDTTEHCPVRFLGEARYGRTPRSAAAATPRSRRLPET